MLCLWRNIIVDEFVHSFHVISCVFSFALDCGVTDANMIVLSEALKVNSAISQLYLERLLFCTSFLFNSFIHKGNLIGNEGAKALSEALKINSTIIAVNLHRFVLFTLFIASFHFS